ncbi:uncharacterized protein LOC125517949 [Triticum urartu]|uniref:uncharacterized protein LOC125517949 n=1 Tax=Triticum urartu TaxID=4572 RepID=UPI0020434B25|nr:uncharacterized protein LOC125517949 [Triticum urartu]
MTPNEIVWCLPERMKIDSVSRFPVIKKSFSVDNAQVLPSTKPSPCKEMMTHPSSKNIESAMTLTPEDANNTTPPSCQPATNVIEKQKNGYSLAKMSIELSEDETTNTEIIGQSGHAREK